MKSNIRQYIQTKVRAREAIEAGHPLAAAMCDCWALSLCVGKDRKRAEDLLRIELRDREYLIAQKRSQRISAASEAHSAHHR